jgi:hypothetical protein
MAHIRLRVLAVENVDLQVVDVDGVARFLPQPVRSQLLVRCDEGRPNGALPEFPLPHCGVEAL